MINRLTAVQQVLQQSLVQAAWSDDEQTRGENVALYRRYADGDHQANMTREMREALRLKKGQEFNVNHCDTIIQAMTDRLKVAAVEGETDAASRWTAGLLRQNRFSGLQMDVHESAVRDGVTFVFVDYDNERAVPVFRHELAYDGIDGMLVIYERSDRDKIAAAVKLWHVTTKAYADTLRVNLYYEDRIERFVNRGDGLKPYVEDGQAAVLDWRMADGTPIGVPVIPFYNRRRARYGEGLSELEAIMPLQDALNRAVHSMVMTSELLGFPVRWVVGYKPAAAIQPGLMIAIEATDAAGNAITPGQTHVEWMKAIRFGQFDAAPLEPFINEARFLVEQMLMTSRTPDTNAMGAALSGESRKQAEIGLLGKVKRFQEAAGNAWEDCVSLAHRIESAFGVQHPPENRFWYTRWVDAEIRNDRDTIENALKLRESVGQREFLRMIAPVYGWDEQRIEGMMQK